MTSVEKRRSGRKSGGHRKHSDGGYSDTSSAGSFLDETDREVSNLTDRAFRSLCIGDEAVYNDSDLSAASPYTQRDRQLAFSQSAQTRDREELKRAAHESFSLRMQQYGQDWIHRGMYGAEIQRDPQWEVYGERTQGRVSATFQQSFMGTPREEESPGGEQLSLLSNGTTDMSSQQRRSRSRVSSLIRAFNSEGHRDGAVIDGNLREWSDDTTWDKSALMSIQRELSEFSSSYQENFNSGHFPAVGPLSAQETNFYASEVAAMTHMNSGSSFLTSSHSKHSVAAQVNSNSNFFIHSEFSPFKVWRDHNRFPFQQGEVSGFMHYPDFPRWYQTPMYKELSLETQPQGPYRFGEERGFRHPRSNFAPDVPPALPRSTSTSTMLQKTSALEKRCDSELTGHYTYRKRTQSLGANRLPAQRPSTASPTVEMSRRVQDTISSVRALQQKIKMMTEQNISNQPGVAYSNENHAPFGNYETAPNVVSNNTSTTPFNVSQPRQYAASPQPVEHPPVRAESRGATPDIRSSYKSRATNLLFNLKDNRKRVKSTYSPPKFKGPEAQERVKQPPIQEPRDTVIDMPDFLDGDVQYPQGEKSNHHYVNQYHNPGSAITTTTNYDPVTAYAGQYSEYAQHNYQIQPEMVHQSAFRHENYTNNQLTNGQCLHEDLQFIPYEQGTMGNEYRHQPLYTGTEIPRVHADNNQTRDLVGQRDNSYDYSNVSAQDGWRQTNSQDVQPQNLNAALSPWKQEMERQQLDYQRVAMMRAEPCLPRDAYGRENAHTSVNTNMSNQLPQYRALSSNTEGNPASYGQQQQQQQQQQSGAFKGWQRKDDKEIEIKDASSSQTFNQYTHQEYRNQNILSEDKDTFRRKQHTPTPNRPEELKPPRNYNPDNVSEPKVENQAKERKSEDVKPGQDMAVNVKVKHAQEELALAQHWAKEQQPEVEPARLNLAEQTGSGEVRAETVPAEPSETQRVNQDRGDHVKEQSTDKQPEVAKQTPAQTETDEPSEVREEAGAEHMKEEQDEQVRVTQAEAERVKEEHIKTEQERIEQAATRERINAEILQDEKLRAEQAERQRAEEEKVKAELKEKEEQEKAQQVEARVDEINNTPQIITDTAERVEERFEEQANLKETTTKPQPTIKEMIQEMSAKTAKPAKPALPQPAKSEPDKVEQVKTELAKAKAELAKIKEKMRGEQKHKVKITAPTKEDEIAKEVCGSTPQQSEDLGVTSRVTDTANRGLYEYNLLKEKYGFTDSPIIINNPPAAGNVSLNDANETPDLSSDRLETTNEKSKDSLTNKSETANTANTDDVSSFKPNELTESQYVYSESSKEFKLSNSIPTVEEKTANSGDKTTTTGESIGKVKEDRVDPLIQPVRDSIIVPQPPVERKLKDHPPNPPKTLSHKDRSQTKQELLTSKIKAHAEKEISAIREKGFALRDGLMSKSSSKQFGGGQVGSVRQRPPSQETPKKHDSTTSSNTKPKHQNESQGIQMAPVSSAAIQAKSATTTSQLVDGFQKVPKDETVSKQPRDQNKDKESLRPSKEQPSKNKQGNHGDTVQKKEAPPTMKEKTESEHEAVLEDSAPTLSLVLGPNTTPVEDESLQIRGIMVTVRERKPSLTVTDYPQDQIQATAAAEVNSEINKYPSSDLDSSKGNKAPKKVSKAETEDKVEQDAHDKTEESMSVDYENTKGTKQNNRSENVGGKRSEELLHGPYTDTRPQREIQPQEPLAEKSSPTTLTVPAKNKTLAETQPLLHTTTTKTLKENSTTWEEMVDIKSPTQETNLQRGGTTAPDDFNVGMKTNHHINNSNVTETERKTKSDIQPTEEDEKHHLAPTNKCNPSENDNVENTQVDENVHIDSIAIRVVPAVIEDNVRKAETERVSSDVTASNKQVSSSIVEGTMKTPRKEETTKDSQTPLEDNSVQSVLEGVKQLSDSLKTATRNPGNSADESKTQPSEGDYFQDTESKSSVSSRERLSARNANPSKEYEEKPEVKPKPKPRVSTIPEISALADYARLKVIVSEEQENPVQEFPPNKKEGFFPLIQTRHSRRPVFTADPQDFTVKEKALPKKTEASAKVSKEPKPLVFPITEKEHQRTGMFKLGDKERQEKFPSDAKASEDVADPKAKHAQYTQEKNKTPQSHLKKQGEKEQGLASRDVLQKRGAPEEQQRRAAQEEEEEKQRKAAKETQRRAAQEEQEKRAAQEELQRRAAQEEQERIAAKEEQRRAAQEEQRRRAAEEEKQKRAAQEEQRRAAQEQQRIAAQEEQQRRAAQEERRRAAQEEQQRRAAKEEQQRRAAQEEQQRRAAQEEQQRRAAQEEQQRRAAQEEQRIAAQEEQQRRAAQEEQQRIAAHEERMKAAQEEQHRRAAQEKQQRRAAEEEKQRIAAQEEQRRAAQEEEKQRKAAQEERKRAAEEEKKRRLAQEEQQKRAVEEEQRRAAQEEQRRAVHEEQLRRAAQMEQRRRAAEEEKQRRAVEEEQRRAAEEEQQRRAAQEEQERREAEIELQKREESQRRAARRAAREEQQRRAAQEERERRAAQEEQERRAAQEEQERRAALEEQKRREKQEEQERQAVLEEEQWRAALIEEQRQAKQLEEKIRTKVDQHYEKQTEEKEMRAEKDRAIKESQAATKDEEGLTQEQMLIHKDGREQVKPSTKMDALQYYAITSTNSEKKPRERELDSPLPPHQRNHPMGQESSEDPGTHARSYRPHAPASPAPSHPRSNTSSPAPGVRPSMFRVKDNTFKASSFTKSVKPRFHKTFGEDYRVGSPMERGEEEQEKMRRGAGTPVHPDMGSNRFSAIREFSGFQPASSSHDHSGSAPQHRPYSRRSIALDEDDSRSVVSNMSEGVESFATSAADLSELRGLYYDERPESACSFSSDVSRSMGKPPAVPPKSEKALRRAKRLTSRRINKELTKAGGDSSAVDKPLHDVSNIPEVRSPNSHAMASPHFSSPVSLAHAPALGSSLPSSHTEHPSINASPHATGPISLQVASPHATAPVSLPHASHAAAPQTVAHVPPSPTLHRAKHPAPVTQYHVESTYPQSYPLTQRKVLQDIGSGQYFVVDVPVPVKTKTFIDPETGKYVQLNVRESAQNAPRPPPKPQPQQTYQQPLPQASPAGKPVVLYEGYHGYPQGYKPAANKSVPHHRSSAPVTAHQDQQQVRESSRYGYPAPEIRQNSEGPRYSPEKTPYMDTVNDSDKTYNAVYNTHGPYESFPECDTNSQLAGSAVCENDNSAHSRYQPREIISIGELEDFMELSDW
ncbi:cardiac-enriched FHL2-interacting protein [Halichoeres trimaculatus]|uniref:cardiac-enriched FHL2-interacting protein n=1 Tax=Halichoeres trimaculatus TaxID=147232 RepID=UPI003D9F63A2